MVSTKKRYPLVVVEWEDPSLETGIYQPPLTPMTAEVHTAGWLVGRERKHLMIALTSIHYPNDHQVRDYLTIPRALIKSMKIYRG